MLNCSKQQKRIKAEMTEKATPDLDARIRKLSAEFNAVHGQDVLLEFLSSDKDSVNEKHIYPKSFNRDGARYLPAYFMACALNKDDGFKAEIWAAFIEKATPPGNGSDAPMTAKTAREIKQAIIEAAAPLSGRPTPVPKNDNDGGKPEEPSPLSSVA